MDINLLNKKRKSILIITTILMIIIIVIGVILFVLGNLFHFILYLIAPIEVISGLLLLSIFYSMPNYYKLIGLIIKDDMVKKDKNCNITLNRKINKEIDNYYSNDQIKKEKCFDIDYLNIKAQVFSYKCIDKKGISKIYGRLNGKALIINDFKCNDSLVFISKDKESTNRFVDYFSTNYSNRNDLITSVKKCKKYICLYNNELSDSYYELLDEFSGFAFIKIQDNNIFILFDENKAVEDLKLQNEFTNNDVINIKNEYKIIFNILEKISKIRK